MYNVPLDGLKMNALLQYALMDDKGSEDCKVKLGNLTGKATRGKKLYKDQGGGWTNIPTTARDLVMATGLSLEEIGSYLLDAQLEMTSSSLNYKTIFAKSELIAYQLNDRKDMSKNDVARRAMDSILSEYTRRFSRSEQLPLPIGEEALFNIPNWVINDIQTVFGKKYASANAVSNDKGFKIALEKRREEIGSIQTVIQGPRKPLAADFATLINLANKVDAMCCGVTQDGKLNVFYRFVDVMAMREIAVSNKEVIDYSEVYVDKFEQGEQNEKLYRNEIYSVHMPEDGEISKDSRVEFVYDCDSVKTKGEQDKNMKKMFYKLLVQRMLGRGYASVYDLLTEVHGYYAKLVFDYKKASNSSNSVTLLIDSANALEFDEKLISEINKPFLDREMVTQWGDEYAIAFSQVINDISTAVFDVYSKKNGSSQRILSDTAISEIVCISDLTAVASDVEPKMKDYDISWRTLRKLYRELSMDGQVLISSPVNITKLYSQLQFKKISKNMSDVIYDEELPILTPVFPRDKITNLIKLINCIEDPGLLEIQWAYHTAPLQSEEIYDSLATLVKSQSGASLQTILLDLKGSTEYLYLCIAQYDRAMKVPDPRHRIATLFALLFDRKITETNASIERLCNSFVTNFAPQNEYSNFISIMLNKLFSNKDYSMPFCLKQSTKLIKPDTPDEILLNEILETVLRNNQLHIDTVGTLSTLIEVPKIKGYLLGKDCHYRYSSNNRLVIKPLGEKTWGILTSANRYTRVVITKDNTWEIPTDNPLSEKI